MTEWTKRMKMNGKQLIKRTRPLHLPANTHISPTPCILVTGQLIALFPVHV